MLTRQEPQNKKAEMKPRKFLLTFYLCLILFTSLAFIIQTKPVSGFSIIRVPTDFSTIQAAVDNATAGDRIEVAAGIYYEHVEVNKSLTITGENPATVIVDGTTNGTVFKLEASQITITGFTMRNGGSHSAITSEKEMSTNDYQTISNNIIQTSQYGISLGLSNRNTIVNNTFFDNSVTGMYVNDADNNNISGNTISESAYGIRLLYSVNNIIADNTIFETAYGIYVRSASTGNAITRNIISAKTVGIFVNSDTNTVDHNTLAESAYGIYFYNCKKGEIHYNTLIENSYGIRLYWSSPATSDHNVNNNKAVNNEWAIELVNSIGNTFMGNWLQQNTYGAFLSASSSNTLYRNNFVQNSMQAYADALNTWDNSGEGNYWSDYEGVDDNGDGIGDTPYRIIPGIDNYPLMETWSEHDVSIEDATLSISEAYAGWIVTITVTVKNKGKITPPTPETFDVTVKHGLDTIETKQVVNLAQEETTTLTFNWDTTEVSPGNYTISAETSVVPDELNTDNNIFTDGTTKIKIPGDINGDGTVDYDDFIAFSGAYGTTIGQPAYDERADFDRDGDVDYDDFSVMAGNYGQTE